MPLPTGARAINAEELRKCAESADGRRGQALRFVYAVRNDKTAKDGSYLMLEAGEAPAGWTVYDVADTRSEWVRQEHSSEGETIVKITPRGLEEKVLDPGTHDALFWSESAVQKFVFPYYARHLTNAQFETLYQTYMGLKHDGTTKDTQVPMALSHLPTSDYGYTGMVVGLPAHAVGKLGMLSTIGVIVGESAPTPLPEYLLSLNDPSVFDAFL